VPATAWGFESLRPHFVTPDDYIDALEEPRRGEIRALHELIRATVPDLEPHVASGMLGYGPFHYRYASGREGDASLIALASRKQYISLYVLCTTEQGYLAEQYAERLPKASIGKSCVRFKRTEDVDRGALAELIAEARRIGPAAEA
jgi:uncharacterized protein YdhG (YjbR/CyaY superfamily)